MADIRFRVEDTYSFNELFNYIKQLESLLSKCYDELQRHDNDATYNTDPVLIEWIRTTIEVRDLFGGSK